MYLHPHEGFDNAPLDLRHIDVLPLAAAMGAEIRGADLARLTDAQFCEVERSLFRHKMIFLRGQAIDHAGHHSFSRRFGEFADAAYTDGVAGFREVPPLITEADDRPADVFGSGWHTDSPFLAQPPAITILRSVEVPPWGGDAMWCIAALALRTLAPTTRRMIEGLRVHFSMREVLASARANAEPRDNPVGELVATRAMEQLPAGLHRK